MSNRDRLASFAVEHLEAALGARRRRIVGADPCDTTDDLARDLIEILASTCARLSLLRGAEPGDAH